MPKFFDLANQSKRATAQITIYGNRITLTGTSGTANITINSYLNTTIATFATDLVTTAVNWVAANYDYYFAKGFVVTAISGIIEVTPRYGWETVNRINASISAAVSGNLTGTLVGTFEPNLAFAKIWQVTFGQNIIIKRPRDMVEGDNIRLELKATGAYTTTFAPAVAQVDTITMSGTSGTANVTVNGLTKLATFNGTLTQTNADFVTAWAAAYAAAGVAVTASTNTLIFTAKVAGVPFFGPSVVANVTTDLAGTAVGTTPATSVIPGYYFPGGTENVQTSTSLDTVTGTVNLSMFPREDVVTLLGTAGTANITAGGITRLATWNSTLTQTAADFVTSWAADFAGVGLTLTAASGVLTFKVATKAAKYYALPVVTNVTTNLLGTVIKVPEGRIIIDAAAKDIKQ